MASRDLNRGQIEAYGFLMGWFEDWRVRAGLEPGRPAAERFWREVVKGKERQDWQLEQWALALAWYLRWLDHRVARGGDGRSLPERMKAAVHATGARRGLALATRQTYAGWVARFGIWAGTVERAMDETACREWLGGLITETKISFATQRQALNAMVFFYRDVCGKDEVDLQVKMRKRERRMPVVLQLLEVLAIIAQLEPRYRTMVTLQYGAGLRLKELV